jgi:hypothetical protein
VVDPVVLSVREHGVLDRRLEIDAGVVLRSARDVDPIVVVVFVATVRIGDLQHVTAADLQLSPGELAAGVAATDEHAIELDSRRLRTECLARIVHHSAAGHREPGLLDPDHGLRARMSEASLRIASSADEPGLADLGARARQQAQTSPALPAGAREQDRCFARAPHEQAPRELDRRVRFQQHARTGLDDQARARAELQIARHDDVMIRAPDELARVSRELRASSPALHELQLLLAVSARRRSLERQRAFALQREAQAASPAIQLECAERQAIAT